MTGFTAEPPSEGVIVNQYAFFDLLPVEQPEPLGDIKNQLVNDETMTNLAEEIRFIRTIRDDLVDNISRRKDGRITELSTKISSSISDYVEQYGSIPADQIHEIVTKQMFAYFAGSDMMNLKEAESFLKFANAIGGLAEKYRKTLEGMTVNVNFESRHYDRLMAILFKKLPPELLDEVANEVAKDAPKLGSEQVLNL